MTRGRVIGMGAALTLATAAFAQPAATDLGTLASPSTTTGTITGFTAGSVQWLKFTLPLPATNAGGGYLDIDTNGGTLTGGDSMIGLYSSTGAQIASNDDSGPGLYSMLSFGLASPTRPGLAATGNATSVGSTHAGGSGASVISAGTYYLAVTGFSATFNATAWSVTTSHTRTGDVDYRIEYVGNGLPTNPSGTGTATPNAGQVGSQTTLAVNVIPGTLPASTGIGVSVNCALIGAGTVTLLDNGVAPDVAAGDNTFTANVTVGAVGGGTYSLPFTITDAQARQGTGNISFSVVAPPANPVDLGTWTTSSSGQSCVTLAATEIKWFKAVIPAIAHPSAYLDLWTTLGASPLSNADTEIGVYDSVSGTLIATDDDDDDALLSALSFGLTTPTRPAHGTGVAFNGRDGALAGGHYYIALGAFNSTFNATGWSVTSTATATGDACLNWALGTNNILTATAAGPSDTTNCGSSVVTITVNPAVTPPSTGITASIDTSSIGGGPTQLFDNGVAPDATAGDNIFTGTIGAISSVEGVYTLPWTVTDAQSRSATGNLSIRVDTAGDLPSTARQQGDGTSTITGYVGGNDVDMMGICVFDTTGFVANVVGGATYDTQMFLFAGNMDLSGTIPIGTGIVMDDDEPTPGTTLQSKITGFTLPAGGHYYLALSTYDRDPYSGATPVEGTNNIWADTPFAVVRAPDGPGATGVVQSWGTAAGGAGGVYTITLTGATSVCPADLDDGSGSGVPDCGVDINDLVYFLDLFGNGDPGADLDDGNGNGAKDCGVDINDLVFFLDHFGNGC